MTESVATGNWPSFAVVFYDGEQETGLGNIVVSPFLNFKVFQSVIAQKLGLSPHQFSIYVVNRRRHGSRIPVTVNIDFSAISREKDYFFLVVLKRSRCERQRSRRGEMDKILPNRFKPPGDMVLLTRDGNSITIKGGDEFSGLDLDQAGYERRAKELQMQKERYLMNMGFERLSLDTEKAERRVLCEECLRAKEMAREVGFHWCVYDTVTFGFKSHAGPIARPIKESG